MRRFIMNKRFFVLAAAIIIGGIVFLGCDTGTDPGTNDDRPPPSNNPYIGKWIWEGGPTSILKIIDDTHWELEEEDFNFAKGTYVYEENTGTVTVTHLQDYWDTNSKWVPWEDVPDEKKPFGGENQFPVKFEGNTITITIQESEETYSKK
jgi:hypothetical protein